jgi:phage-related protein
MLDIYEDLPMAKSRNFKQGGLNNKKDSLRLKEILKEVRSSQINKVTKSLRKNAVIDENALNGILSSGFLPENQVKALSLYFNVNGITSINESTVRRIDRDLSQLNEGPFDFVKKLVDKGKEVGGKVVGTITDMGKTFIDSFKQGWAGVKKVWSNFKDLLKEFVEMIKKALKKVYEFIMNKVKAVATKISGTVDQDYIENFLNTAGGVKEASEEVHTDVITEFEQLKKTVDHLTMSTDKLMEGEGFADQIISGDADPKGAPPALEPEEIEQGVKQLAAESVNPEFAAYLELKEEIKQRYISIFSKKESLMELYKLQINEGGHLYDGIKSPLIKNIIHWGLLVLKAIFSPFATIVAEVGKLIVGKGLLKGISYFCNKVRNGPGIYKFAILTTLVGELLELIEDGINAIWHYGPIMEVAKVVFAPIAVLAQPLVDCTTTVIHIVHYSVAGMALATIIYNLIPVFKAVIAKLKGSDEKEGGGEEPEVQTAGYKPRGTFKLKEGKLVFIQ